jgi:hypothetical protein
LKNAVPGLGGCRRSLKLVLGHFFGRHRYSATLVIYNRDAGSRCAHQPGK